MASLPPLDPAPSDDLVALRPWREADVPALATACADAAIQRWTRVPSPYEERHAREFVAAAAAAWARGERAEVAVAAAGDDARVLGSVGVVALDRAAGVAEVGYWVAPAARGRGVATRALRLLSDWALARIDGLARIELQIDPRNAASQAVARAAGYADEGRAPGRGACGAGEVRLFARTRP